MSAVLETVKLFWDVMKDGAKLSTAGNTVTVVPKGTSMMDFAGWQGPVRSASCGTAMRRTSGA